MIRPKIGIDWDDVTAPFNSIAIQMANEKYKHSLVLNDIDTWENTGKARIIKEFYSDVNLYEQQKPSLTTINIIHQLMEIAEVYFITAVHPKFMGVRAAQIMDAFPELPGERIILGSAKSLVQFDIVLDDAIHNVLDSPATYPVLMRKPWNKEMTGILAVNNMEEFLILVRQIIQSTQEKPKKIEIPSVLALVGPSGAKKNCIVEHLCNIDTRFVRPVNYCTKTGTLHKYISDAMFEKEDFFEKTRYAGYQYGTKKEDIEIVLKRGKFAIIPVDMCGAIAMKRHFPTQIIFVERDKKSLVSSIISSSLSDNEKTLRILSLDTERKNKAICDYIINNTNLKGAEELLALI